VPSLDFQHLAADLDLVASARTGSLERGGELVLVRRHVAGDAKAAVEGTPPAEAELEQALRAAGARTGSEVEVGEETFELA